VTPERSRVPPWRDERGSRAILDAMTSQPASVTYALQFRGSADAGCAGAAVAARAPSTMLVSVVERNGPHGRFQDVGAAEAVYRVTFDDAGPVYGEVDFGGGTTLALRAAERRPAEPAPRAHLRHGAALLEVVGGTGRLAGVRGLVTSNFLLSDTGDLTDTHLGLLFVRRP
jgi:hypothetical protein